MTSSYSLSQLGPAAFENLVNALAQRILGAGATGFAPGADGGRDGYFEGEAPYPSNIDRWSGVWYIQSKFHAPHLSKDPQVWLIEQIKAEIKLFTKNSSSRDWPNNWIIATNVDVSAVAKKGTFDKIKYLLKAEGVPQIKFDIWGGEKIINFLNLNVEVASAFGHFITPGHVLAKLYEIVSEKSPDRENLKEISHHLIVRQFKDQLYTKLDRAGTSPSIKPTVHDLFIELPYTLGGVRRQRTLLSDISHAAAQCHRYSLRKYNSPAWRIWYQQPRRARTLLVKGGPGQGKSTIGQYLCQIHRAFLILEKDGPKVDLVTQQFAEQLRINAVKDNFWPSSARLPIQIELKEYSHWISIQGEKALGVLTYIAESIGKQIEKTLSASLIKAALSKREWIIVFDGLDEVPSDYKDVVAKEIMHFLNDLVIEIDADILSICTSRPQGYAGQFATIDGPVLLLSPLDVATAMRCAEPLLLFGQTKTDGENAVNTLRSAIASPNIRELMTTPLQAHIMATVVREGGRPPERRWRLFQSFYDVMRRRESLKQFRDERVARLLREEDLLLRGVHMRLGFILHARAELSSGAQTSITKDEFRELVRHVVDDLGDLKESETVSAVMEATTDRLVLVSTPDSGEQVRFDIRQLQEFFAAEYLYDRLDADDVGNRIAVIGVDSHWREVMHFLMSALITGRRTGEFAVAINELRRFNDGDAELKSDLYCRRTAPASLLAGRLLIEGVVEENKHDRYKLQPIFDGHGGVFDLDSLRFIASIRAPKTRAWVVERLIERIKVVAPSEYTGSIFLIGLIDNPTPENWNTVTDAFFGMEVFAQEQCISHWCPIFHWDEEEQNDVQVVRDAEFNDWVVQIAIRIMNSDDWIKYSDIIIRKLQNFFRIEPQRFLRIWKSLGYISIVAEKILGCFVLNDPTTDFDMQVEFDCGAVDAGLFPLSWWSISYDNPASEGTKLYLNTSGALRAVLICLEFSKYPSKEMLDEYIVATEIYGAAKMACLPSSMIGLMPIENWQSSAPCNVDHLKKIPEDVELGRFIAGLKTKILPPFSGVTIYSGIKRKPNTWKKFIKYLPQKAIELAFDTEQIMYHASIVTSAGFEELLFARLSQVRSLILLWGALEKGNSALFHKMKNLVIASEDFSPVVRVSRGDSIFPFKISLPSDKCLLVLLAPAMIAWWLNQLSKGEAGRDIDFVGVIGSFGISLEQLELIAFAENNETSISAGAAALFWLCRRDSQTATSNNHDVEIERSRNLYFKLRNNSNERWFSQAFVYGLILPFAKLNSLTMEVANSLFRDAARGLNGDAILVLIRAWRELSNTPVNKAGLLSDWLGYKTQVLS